MKDVRRRWDHNHPQNSFDSDFEDFTPTYAYSINLEDSFMIMAINGFSCSYPECCVFDFLRKWWKFAHTRDLNDIRAKHHGVTKTGQNYAQCEGHKGLNRGTVPSSSTRSMTK